MVNSRKKWVAYEQWLAREYRELWFPDALTSRNSSLKRDAEWVDLTWTDPFNIQAKCYANFPVAKAISVLKEMPNETNMNILHVKVTRKGEVVILDKECWYKIVEFIMKNRWPTTNE